MALGREKNTVTSSGERFIGRRVLRDDYTLITERHSNGVVILHIVSKDQKHFATLLPAGIDELIELVKMARAE